jgi:predicted DNA-binding antitoxin AbrB/MazE fold protein
MTGTITAVFEKGVFRPLEPVEIPEGERVHLEVWPGPAAVNETLDRIARTVVIREGDHFSGEEHDRVIYGGKPENGADDLR